MDLTVCFLSYFVWLRCITSFYVFIFNSNKEDIEDKRHKSHTQNETGFRKSLDARKPNDSLIKLAATAKG
ncbi:hypothetical protein QVD17_36693 [Tagetes erecta]|uniref:Uncharacterized protein n=1 Tax=Tagetes erecta TaxID=13708 RepID=A0AAD8JUP9_TARER|nr:hypothetical protein QVD17_36693 [Tagetes erecta]